MQLKYLRSVLSPEESIVEVSSLAWAPNNLKLAVATTENVVVLFDDMGIRKDRFSLRAIDIKNGRSSFSVTGLAFSPDSLKIAVGQSDKVIFVYRIGDEWGEKKSICSKFVQQYPVTCLLWLSEGPIIYGLTDGRVRSSNIKSSKSKTLYNTGSCVVSLAANSQATGILSGHMDGSIIRYYVKFDPHAGDQGIIIRIRDAPFALAWANDFILTAGSDPVVMVYRKTGELHKVFDYTDDETDEMFYVARTSPNHECVVFGCYDGLRCYSWKPRKEDWEEDYVKKIEGLSDITCIAWKEDGSRLVIGTSSGACDIFQTALRRLIFRKKIEVSYVGPSQMVIKSLIPGSKGVFFGSVGGKEIEEVRVMGDKDQYVVARTAGTLILVNLEQELVSEVPWLPPIVEEIFIFRYPSVCLIYLPGELTILEYGSNEVLMTIYTDIVTPPLISVRITERGPNVEVEYKRIAYMVDVFTVCIADLDKGRTISSYQHTLRIDWLDLNETGKKLIFQDIKKGLFLMDVATKTCFPLLSRCSFVQWIERSNALVAQYRKNLHVWYNVNNPEETISYGVVGLATDVVHDKNQVFVVAEEGDRRFRIDLDRHRLDFQTALAEKDLNQAYAVLMQTEFNPDIQCLWDVLAVRAVKALNYSLARECYGKLEDLPHVHFVNNLQALVEKNTYRFNETYVRQHPLFRIQMAIFDKDIDAAVEVYLKIYELEEAVNLCMRFLQCKDAYDMSLRFNLKTLETSRDYYISFLVKTKQFQLAAELKESEGQLASAFFYFLKADNPSTAAQLMMKRKDLMNDKFLTDFVLNSLKERENYQIAGELYEQLNDIKSAFKMYYACSDFSKAIELARRLSPAEVVLLEEKWADHLMTHQQPDAAINHYIEAGLVYKALEASLVALQWKKAAEIIKVIDDVDSLVTDIQKTAQYFASIKDYDCAEDLYAKAELWEEAIDMYREAGEWERAQRMTMRYLDNTKVTDLVSALTVELADEGKLEEAEQFFVILGDPDAAITMYKRSRRYDDLLRMVRDYHPDLLKTTYLRLAQELESEGRFDEAKYYFLQINDHNSVIKMYQALGKWGDAYELAKKYAAPRIADHVAYLWAKEVGGLTGVKLLKKLDALETSIEFACDSHEFDFAFLVAKSGMPSKLPHVHYKYAMSLEDDGKFEAAEAQFVKAKKPREAVLMYLHCKDWKNASRVAEKHDNDSLVDVLKFQAKTAFENKRYKLFEQLLLRASETRLIVTTYKEAGMWKEALRACNAYLPNSEFDALEDEYSDAYVERTTSKMTAPKWIFKAQEFEKKKQYEEAIQCYLQVDESLTNIENLLTNAWKTAAELSCRYLDQHKATEIAKVLAPKIIKVNDPKLAIKLYLAGGMHKEAIDLYISIGDWNRAKKVAEETDASYVQYVENKYTDMLVHGGMQKIIDRKEAQKEIRAQLDKLILKNEWARCMVLAEEHKVDFLDDYVAKYAMHLIQMQSPYEAIDLFLKYGAPLNETTFFIYRKLVNSMLRCIPWSFRESYKEWANLRTLLLILTDELKNTSLGAGINPSNEFEKLLLIIHYMAAREAYRAEPCLVYMATKISVAMVRYTDVIPPDRAFFEAGADCRLYGLDSEAIFYFNIFLDIHESIKEGNWDSFDNSDFKYLDVPFDLRLPAETFVDDTLRDEARDWILSHSLQRSFNIEELMDNKKRLPVSLSPRNDRESRGDPDGEVEAVSDHSPCRPCVLSGFPVFMKQRVKPLEFKKHTMFANREDWLLVVTAGNKRTSSEINDVISFIYKWCGEPLELTMPE